MYYFLINFVPKHNKHCNILKSHVLMPISKSGMNSHSFKHICQFNSALSYGEKVFPKIKIMRQPIRKLLRSANRSKNDNFQTYINNKPTRPAPSIKNIKQYDSAQMKKQDIEWQIFKFLVGDSRTAQTLENMKKLARNLMKLIVRQCEVHGSQRLRRMVQLHLVYSRMWGEEVTKTMLNKLQKLLLSRSRHLLMSAVCISNYEWDKKKISDDRMNECVNEIETVNQLCEATIYCKECNKRLILGTKCEGVNYCSCSSGPYVDKTRCYESWEAFLERDHILVWRRKNPTYESMYSYKVYGTYDDLSLNAFLEVQLNTEFRPQWDDTVLKLEVHDSHPDSNSDLLYWLVKFPTFFSNRDYVFKRRFTINEDRKEVIIVNERAEFSGLPQVKGVHRVEDYWSVMVIRSTSDFDKPGMEYTLTYFDNPGTTLPTSITNFIASTGFPNFLEKVYKAAMSLQKQHEIGKDVYATLPDKIRYPGRESKTILDTIVPLIEENISKELVPYEDQISLTNEKDKNIDHDQHQSEAQNENINSLQSSIKDDISVLLKSKNVVMDLLEAMDVVSPDLDAQTFLSKKLEELTKYGKENIEKNSVLFEKFEEIKDMLEGMKNRAFNRKEEIIKETRELNIRKIHYDLGLNDEATLSMLQNAFSAMTQMLEEDKNIRIGKGYFKNSNTKKEEKTEDNCDKSEDKDNKTKGKYGNQSSNSRDRPDKPPPTAMTGVNFKTFDEPKTSTQNSTNSYSYNPWPLVPNYLFWWFKSENKYHKIITGDYKTINFPIITANSNTERQYSTLDKCNLVINESQAEITTNSDSNTIITWIWYPINSSYKVMVWITNLFSSAKAADNEPPNGSSN